MSKKLVSFKATKKLSKPIKVNFTTETGQQVSFKATKKITKPVRIKFYTKKDGK